MFQFLEDYKVRMENMAPFAYLFEKLGNARKYGEYDLFSLTFSTLLFILEGMLTNSSNDIHSISGFLQDLIYENHGIKLTSQESEEVCYYILYDLLQNNGFTYEYEYINTFNSCREVISVSLIAQEEFKIGGKSRYKLTTQGMELLFMTKEVYKELRITIKQLYLKQQLEKRIFDEALRTVDDINLLVRQLREQVKEMVRKIRMNALNVQFSEYEDIHERIFEQFKREKTEFESLNQMVESQKDSLGSIEKDKMTDNDRKALVVLHEISEKLNSIINEHNRLFVDKLDLQRIYRDAIKNQIAAGFRVRINFDTEILDAIMKSNGPMDVNRRVIAPLFKLRTGKSFNIFKCMEDQVQRKDTGSAQQDKIDDDFDEQSEDDKKVQLKKRHDSFKKFLKLILSNINSKGETAVHILLDRADAAERDKLISSFDFYTFLILFHQAGEIDLEALQKERDSIIGSGGDEVDIEWVILSVMDESPGFREYKTLTFYRGEKSIKLENGVEMSDFKIKCTKSRQG